LGQGLRTTLTIVGIDDFCLYAPESLLIPAEEKCGIGSIMFRAPVEKAGT
jgi:hypothetical protein